MRKKKAIKILSTFAIAGSAFVAGSPSEAASVSEVEKLLKDAKEAGTVLKWAISIEGTADGKTRPWAAYNQAKTAYEQAVKAVNTLPTAQRNRYLAELDEHVKLHISRTMHYIDAITAGEKIKVKQQALNAQLNRNLINDDTEKAYHELSREIRKQTIMLDRVYGKSTRDLIRSHYKQASERVRDSALYAVTVKIELDLAQRAIAVNNFAKAEKHLSEARKYIIYVENVVIKKVLTDRLQAIGANFFPKVDKVSAAEPKRVKVEFSKAMLARSSTNGAENIGNYAVSGRTIKSVALSSDKKMAIIELYDSLSQNTAYTVTVKKNIQTANYETLGNNDYVSSFNFSDKIKPTVTAVQTNRNGNVEISFSELIDRNSPIAVTIDGKSVKISPLNSDSDKVVVLKSELDRIGLRKGRSYSIVLSGARDLVEYNPNIMNTHRSNFVYNPAADTIAPEVKSLQVKDERTITIEFSETLASFTASSNLSITKGNTTVHPTSVKDISDGSKTKFEIVLPTSVYSSNEVTARLIVQVKNYKDLEGNTGRTTDRIVTINKDVTPPRFVNASYQLNTNEIQITFDKPLKVAQPDRNKIALYYQGNAITPSLKTTVDNKLIINANGLKDGLYTIEVAAGAVQDRSISENKNSKFTTSVTKKADNVKPTVSFRETNENGQFKALFSKEVNLESATTSSNYLIGGRAIPRDSVLSIDNDRKIVTITLPEGTIQTTQRYTITAQRVKDLSDNIMDTYSNAITLTDNTQPILDWAGVEGNNLKLIFSENIYLLNDEYSNFTIEVNGKNLTSNQYRIETKANTKELTIIPLDDTTFTSGKISITTRDKATIHDGAGNILKGGTKITVR